MKRDTVLLAGAALLLLAATASFGRVFLDDSWQPLAWSAIGLPLLVAYTAKRLRMGPVAAFLASGVVFAVYTYIVHLEPGGLLPGPVQMREFVDLASQGLTDLVAEPAPARPLPSLLLLVSTAVWWASHVVHELLVRHGWAGQSIAVGALVWAFPLAVPQPPGRTWPQAIPFLAAAMLVLLIEPDPDLGSWRRPAGRSLLPSSNGIVVGAAAIVIATVAPGVLPGYGAEPLVDISNANAARGYQPIVDVSRRLKLPTPRDLLRVRADRPYYLRLAGLDTFDGATWRLGPPDEPSFSPEEVMSADRLLPPEVEIGEAILTEVRIENLSLENVFAPAPYHPVRVEGAAADRMVYSREGTFLATSDTLEDEPALVPGLSYAVEAAIPTPTEQQLSSVAMEAYDAPLYSRWTQLPEAYGDLARVTDEVVANAGASTPYQIAFALQEFFRGGDRFTYSTDVPALRGAGALTRFVTQDRSGYCEYYATAMAVMLRLRGVPARVAVGFRLGDQLESGEYLVTTDDAHAWVEVLFPGYGWIQFEPTPSLGDTLVPRPEDATPELSLADQERQDPGDPAANPNTDVPDELNDLANRGLDDQRGPQGGPTAAPAGDGDRGPLPIVLGILAVIAGLGAALALTRRGGRHDPTLPDDERVLEAQRRLYRTARSLGVGRRDSETAVEVARRWAHEGRVDADGADRLARLAQAAAFGGLLEARAGDEAERLEDELIDGLRASVTRGSRLAAPVRIPYEATVDTGRRAATVVLDRVRATRADR